MKKHYEYVRKDGEINNDPSLTVPGQARSLAKMIEQQQNGMVLLSNGLYYTEEEDPPYTLNDLTDIDEARKNIEHFKRKVLKIKKENELTNKTPEE